MQRSQKELNTRVDFVVKAFCLVIEIEHSVVGIVVKVGCAEVIYDVYFLFHTLK